MSSRCDSNKDNRRVGRLRDNWSNDSRKDNHRSGRLRASSNPRSNLNRGVCSARGNHNGGNLKKNRTEGLIDLIEGTKGNDDRRTVTESLF